MMNRRAGKTRIPNQRLVTVVREKLDDAMVPAFAPEFAPEEAELAGAFAEFAVGEGEAAASLADLPPDS